MGQTQAPASIAEKNHYMDHRFHARVIFRMRPKQYVTNILLGWPGCDSAAEGVSVYKEWILKKGQPL